MKKILSVVLALTMIMTLGLTAFAAAGDDINQGTPNTSTSIVKTSTIKEDGTTPGETWSVAIPAETVLAWEQASKAVEYTATTQLLWNHLLEVTVSAANYATTDAPAMTFTTPGAKTYALPYSLANVTAATNDPVVTDFAMSATVNVAAAAWKTVPVAEYSDTVTFTATVVTNANA